MASTALRMAEDAFVRRQGLSATRYDPDGLSNPLSCSIYVSNQRNLVLASARAMRLSGRTTSDVVLPQASILNCAGLPAKWYIVVSPLHSTETNNGRGASTFGAVALPLLLTIRNKITTQPTATQLNARGEPRRVTGTGQSTGIARADHQVRAGATNSMSILTEGPEGQVPTNDTTTLYFPRDADVTWEDTIVGPDGKEATIDRLYLDYNDGEPYCLAAQIRGSVGQRWAAA